MKTIEIKLYQFDELSENAQQTAINWWREGADFQYLTEEAVDSLNEFCDLFNVTWSNIDFDEPYHNEYRFNIDEDFLSLSNHKLAKYIWNNYSDSIYKGKYYGKLVDTDKDGKKIEISKEHPNGLRHVKRRSKCQLENCCVLTGVGYDDDLLKPVYDFLDHPSKTDFETLLHDCINSLCHSVSSEIEANMEDENVADSIRANEYEFIENGEKY